MAFPNLLHVNRKVQKYRTCEIIIARMAILSLAFTIHLGLRSRSHVSVRNDHPSEEGLGEAKDFAKFTMVRITNNP